MLNEIESRIAATAGDLRRHELAVQRLADLAARRESLLLQVRGLTARAADEQEDVDSLEKMSITRVVASLLGRREEKLAAERAEAAAALLKLEDAESRLGAVDDELAVVRAQVRELANAEGAYADALADKEAFLARRGDAAGRRLLEIAGKSGRLDGELKELDEARRAADQAKAALTAARASLSSASGWSTYDTFFGGGAISSSVKHQRLEEAAAAAAAANRQLVLLRTELADVAGFDVELPDLAVDGTTRFIDVWFDNIFTDLAVRERIRAATGAVEACDRIVDQVRRRLAARRNLAMKGRAELRQERLTLLGVS